MYVCVCVCVCVLYVQVCVCVCECVWERERERESVCVCVCVHAHKRTTHIYIHVYQKTEQNKVTSSIPHATLRPTHEHHKQEPKRLHAEIKRGFKMPKDTLVLPGLTVTVRPTIRRGVCVCVCVCVCVSYESTRCVFVCAPAPAPARARTCVRVSVFLSIYCIFSDGISILSGYLYTCTCTHVICTRVRVHM